MIYFDSVYTSILINAYSVYYMSSYIWYSVSPHVLYSHSPFGAPLPAPQQNQYIGNIQTSDREINLELDIIALQPGRGVQ